MYQSCASGGKCLRRRRILINAHLQISDQDSCIEERQGTYPLGEVSRLEEFPSWVAPVIINFVPRLEARLLDDAVSPLVETLIKNNGSSGHLRTLVRLLLRMMGELREESKCER